MTKPEEIPERIATALRAGLSDPESDTRYAMIDILTLIASPTDFDPVIDIITDKLKAGLANKETINETLYIINYLLNTHLTITDFMDGELK